MVIYVFCYRFIAVTMPIKYAKHKNSKRVYVMLALTWIVSIAISSPIALGFNYTDSRKETPNLCVFYNSDFLIYSSMGSFYIPCIIMILLYWRIFRAIRLRARKAAMHKMARVIENRAEYNVIENRAQTRTIATSDTSATEDGCQRELLPSSNSNAGGTLKNSTARCAFARSPIAEETSFSRFNKASTTEGSGEDESHSQSQAEGGDGVRSHNSDDDGAHVIPNNRSAEFTLSPSSEENHNRLGTHVSFNRDVDSGYSAPTMVEVETNFAAVTSPTSSRVLLSPPPRRPVMGQIQPHNGASKKKGGRKSPDASRSVTRFNFHLNRHHTKKKKDRTTTNKRERKATKTLAIVLGKSTEGSLETREGGGDLGEGCRQFYYRVAFCCHPPA